MLLIGLTGGIGSGKSTVARLLERRGAVVIDADHLAREAVAKGSPGSSDGWTSSFAQRGSESKEEFWKTDAAWGCMWNISPHSVAKSSGWSMTSNAPRKRTSARRTSSTPPVNFYRFLPGPST